MQTETTIEQISNWYLVTKCEDDGKTKKETVIYYMDNPLKDEVVWLISKSKPSEVTPSEWWGM